MGNVGSRFWKAAHELIMDSLQTTDENGEIPPFLFHTFFLFKSPAPTLPTV